MIILQHSLVLPFCELNVEVRACLDHGSVAYDVFVQWGIWSADTNDIVWDIEVHPLPSWEDEDRARVQEMIQELVLDIQQCNEDIRKENIASLTSCYYLDRIRQQLERTFLRDTPRKFFRRNNN